MWYRLLGVDATAVALCDARGFAVVERRAHGSISTRSGVWIGVLVRSHGRGHGDQGPISTTTEA